MNKTTDTHGEIIEIPRVEKREENLSQLGKITSNGTISAAVMVFAALAAIIVANSPAHEAVEHFIHTPLEIAIGSLSLNMSLEVFVNDFLMAIFFLLVGIELKFEMTVGQLKHLRQAALPMLAAVGGVVVPAVIYLALNDGTTPHGWAIPIATDIAFALGVMSLLGNKVAPATKVFFSTLAIADDILAIIVIAVAYGQSPNIAWLTAAIGVTFILWCMNHAHIQSAAPYMWVGLVLWYCLYRSGVHATLSGVILALFLPVHSELKLDAVGEWLNVRAKELEESYNEDEHILGQHHFTARAQAIESVANRITPPLQRVEHTIAVPVNFFILPLFAFVNAQVRLVGMDLGTIVSSPVTQGAFFGAALGKPLGIIGVTYLLVKIGFAKLPHNVDWNQIIAVGIMGGLGFTMSILIAGLAFEDPTHILAAKCAILAGSVVSSIIGIIFVNVRCKRRGSNSKKLIN